MKKIKEDSDLRGGEGKGAMVKEPFPEEVTFAM